MSRPLVLDLHNLSPGEIERFDSLLLALRRIRGRRAVFGKHHLMIEAEGVNERIGIGYSLLPEGTRRSFRSRRGIPALTASIVDAVTSGAAIRSACGGVNDPKIDWYDGWDRIRLLAASIDPSFMDHNPAASAGSPWRAPRCYAFADERPLLPQEVVDHGFSSSPHVLEFSFRQFDCDDRTFATTHEGPLGFDDEPLDPVAVMRAWAEAPENVRMAA